MRTQRSETGFLVLLDGEEKSLYFGPQRLIPISEDSKQHMTAGE